MLGAERSDLQVKLTVIDLDRTRKYLAALGSMCSDAGARGSPAVLRLALEVLARQGDDLRELLQRLRKLDRSRLGRGGQQ